MEGQSSLDPIPLVRDVVRHPLPNPSERVCFRVQGPLVQPPREGIDWNMILDLGLFSALFAAGAAALYYRNELRGAVFGEILVNSGITPIVLASWALLAGSSMQNMIKAASAGVLFSVGYSILNMEGELEWFDWSGLVSLFGPALLELGFVFFISKMFFLAEDAELQVERLEEELAEAKRSPGVGLAMSYFYNFLLPTTANFTGVGTRVTLGMNNADQYSVAEGRYIYIFIPRTLNETDMKAQLREMQTAKKAHQGKPVELHGASHRPMFLFFLERDDDKKSCGFAFDIPTVISSCWDRAKDSSEPDAVENIAQEIVDFQNELQKLVSANAITKDRVALVSVPPAPFDAAALLHIARRIE